MKYFLRITAIFVLWTHGPKTNETFELFIVIQKTIKKEKYLWSRVPELGYITPEAATRGNL